MMMPTQAQLEAVFAGLVSSTGDVSTNARTLGVLLRALLVEATPALTAADRKVVMEEADAEAAYQKTLK